MGPHPARRSCFQRPGGQQPHGSPSSEANHIPRNGFGWPPQLLHPKGDSLCGKVATENGWSSLPTPVKWEEFLHHSASRFGLLVYLFIQLVCKVFTVSPQCTTSPSSSALVPEVGWKILPAIQGPGQACWWDFWSEHCWNCWWVYGCVPCLKEKLLPGKVLNLTAKLGDWFPLRQQSQLRKLFDECKRERFGCTALWAPGGFMK